MNYFKLGSNFDLKLIDEVNKLNDKYEGRGKVIEFYGSERKSAWLTARPDFRLPDVDKKNFEQFIKNSLKSGIGFNYTMNSINPGSKLELENKVHIIEDFIKYLKSLGINRVTIANPILCDIIRSFDENIEIEISTIAHLDTVTQFKYFKEKYNVKKICNSILKNRSVNFLKSAQKFCSQNNIIFELMVNEFCGVGGNGYVTHCAHRDSCYIAHSSDKTKEDAQLFNTYPMGHCITTRKMDDLNWLRLRWIRPEDLKKYNSIGISNFKITGRTGSTEYLSVMAEAYLSEIWNDNLLKLWKPLETIHSGQNELDFEQPTFIDNSKLNGFIDHWFDMPNFDCANELCGETCKYCEEFHEARMK